MTALALTEPRRHVPTLVAGLLLVAFYPVLGGVLLPPESSHLAHEAGDWIYMTAVLMLVLRGTGASPAWIGIRRPGIGTLGWAIGTVLAIFLAAGLTHFALSAIPGTPATDGKLQAQLAGSPWYSLAVALRAGVCEEILYRGIAIELLARLTGRRWVAGLGSILLFFAAHVPSMGWRQLALVLPASVLLTLLYLRRRDMAANSLAHFLIDSLSLVQLALQSKTF